MSSERFTLHSVQLCAVIAGQNWCHSCETASIIRGKSCYPHKTPTDWGFRTARREVDLDPTADPINSDPSGLITGLLFGIGSLSMFAHQDWFILPSRIDKEQLSVRFALFFKYFNPKWFFKIKSLNKWQRTKKIKLLLFNIKNAL